TRDIDLRRGSGRLVGTVIVAVDGVRRTARHDVIATGSDPIAPPIPGLRAREGVWRTRRGKRSPRQYSHTEPVPQNGSPIAGCCNPICSTPARQRRPPRGVTWT